MKEITYKSNNIPIIFVHKGGHSYLKIAIEQAHKSNPNSRIILIGDESNKYISNIIERYSFEQLMIGNDFNDYFISLCDAQENIQKIWINRWFAINNFMKKYHISSVFYMDSDILLFADITKEFYLYRNKYELSYPYYSGHTCFISTQKALDKFCQYIYLYYKDKKHDLLKLSKEKWPYGGFCDMSFFQMYNNEANIGNLQNCINGYYDMFVNQKDDCEEICGKKNIYLVKDDLYFKKNNAIIPCYTIHFQMHMKSFMGIIVNKKIFLYRAGVCILCIIEYLYFKFNFIKLIRKYFKKKSLQGIK